MESHILKKVLNMTKAKDVEEVEEIQSLWSGYGSICRYYLTGSHRNTVIVKHVKFPGKKSHPRGGVSDLSHKRKVKSYDVESHWYSSWSSLCDEKCRVPNFLGMDRHGEEFVIVLEDLDASGFPDRRSSVTPSELELLISWLANFHGKFLGEKPEGLWKQGTYWHLDTRPDEFKAMEDSPLKKAAGKIDTRLKSAKFKTILHGDAKLANFCFSSEGASVAAVDFQYVGGGCGMKDLAYLVGSCLSEEECESWESDVLAIYFMELKKSLTAEKDFPEFDELENEWRKLYPVAWADFHRFLKGWSPGHWKINSYRERVCKKVVEELSIFQG